MANTDHDMLVRRSADALDSLKHLNAKRVWQGDHIDKTLDRLADRRGSLAEAMVRSLATAAIVYAIHPTDERAQALDEALADVAQRMTAVYHDTPNV
jgi:hypothetical protein